MSTDEIERPVVMAVDEAPDDLAAVQRELSKRYGEDYEVRALTSPSSAMRQLQDLRDNDRPVALVLAGHWMTEMLGTDLLGRVGELHPTAKRGLLVTWGDRLAGEPILQAMSRGRFDYYVRKPSTAPDEEFHAAIEGFLAEWARAHSRGFTPVVVVGDPRTARAHELRDLFARNGLPRQFHEPTSAEGAALLAQASLPATDAPTVFVLGAVALVDPSNAQIADALGVNTTKLHDEFDVVIVGAGPSGLGAAVYAASEGLRTLVIEREALGGQASTSSRIRNFLGFPAGVSGSDLAVRAYEQAWLFGAKFHFMRHATMVQPHATGHTVVLSDGTRVTARAVILATGVTYRRLDLPGLEALIGAGVFYGAAASEAPSVRGQRVFVAGGGNSAGQAAIHLAKYADLVTILVRGAGLAQSMSEYLITEIAATANIRLKTEVEIVDGEGPQSLRRLTLRNTATGAHEITDADALFVMIGAQPHTEWLPAEITRDRWGFIVTGLDLLSNGQLPGSWPLQRAPLLLETGAPGVFAVGDVRHRSIKRVASAVGEGSICIASVHEYLSGTM